jgi:hypothetical protein
MNATPPYEVDVEDHRLELLNAYTIFHIGLYMTLTGALIAVETHDIFPGCIARIAIVCFLIAGACGGLIAVNVAEFDVTLHKTSEFFGDYQLRLWGGNTIAKYRVVAIVEHAAFWIGIITLAIDFLFFPIGHGRPPIQ